jgi:hypothetical protein
MSPSSRAPGGKGPGDRQLDADGAGNDFQFFCENAIGVADICFWGGLLTDGAVSLTATRLR